MRKVDGSEVTDDEIERLKAPALRTFFNVSVRWKLSLGQESRLLDASLDTIVAWRGGKYEDVKADTLMRLSFVLGIFGDLVALFGSADNGSIWLVAPRSEPPFLDRSPLEAICAGSLQALADVRAYLGVELDRAGLFPA